MRLPRLDDDLNQKILSGQALDAFEQYYADDCVVQEIVHERFYYHAR